jgi:hypothetical protein
LKVIKGDENEKHDQGSRDSFAESFSSNVHVSDNTVLQQKPWVDRPLVALF